MPSLKRILATGALVATAALALFSATAEASKGPKITNKACIVLVLSALQLVSEEDWGDVWPMTFG